MDNKDAVCPIWLGSLAKNWTFLLKCKRRWSDDLNDSGPQNIDS